jgi:hypothetical protein
MPSSVMITDPFDGGSDPSCALSISRRLPDDPPSPRPPDR